MDFTFWRFCNEFGSHEISDEGVCQADYSPLSQFAETSVGANYRATCRARSRADFVSKLGIVLEETDETLYWMEIIVETEIVRQEKLESLMQEANELISIFVASLNTARTESDRGDAQ